METNELVTLGMQMKKLIEKKCAPMIEKYDLRPVELDILVFLKQSEKADTAKDIMHSRHISKAHISKSIENLRTRGYVQVYEDGQDHRIVHISLTEKAKDAVSGIQEVYQSCRRVMMQNVTLEEIEVLQRVIGKMQESISKELE